MKRIEQLEEKVRVMGSMKSMSHLYPNWPQARKPAAVNEGPAFRPKLNFV
jgi:hypothetical protein